MGTPSTMDTVHRALAREPVGDLAAAESDHGWGAALDTAVDLGPAGCLDLLEASGLRGRGGAGFPTGRKWRTVAGNSSPTLPATVVVNAAEGEPGSFKDRAILRWDPFRVLEGALIAAVAVDADAVVVATKHTFHREIERLRTAIEQVRRRSDGIDLYLFEGPTEYLYGEESALLEAIAGRPPFPRIAPPYRAGIDEEHPSTKSAAEETLAAPGVATPTPPTLVNNVETLANVPGILERGAEWFRSIGTTESPGSVVCTVTGRARRHGVAEVPMGTPLGEVIEGIGGGPFDGRRLVAAISGVANPLVPADAFDTPLSYEAMRDAGSGLGAAGYIVFDDQTDPVALAHGISRFLAVESCGQCTPCKLDGLAVADSFDKLRSARAGALEITDIRQKLDGITEGARCNLAAQHQQVVGSILSVFGAEIDAHIAAGTTHGTEVVAPIADLQDGRAVLATAEADKQPDWSRGPTDSGKTPAARLATSTQGA